MIKQISLFLENRTGRLAQITKLLADNGIDIRALSIAETSDYGILRIIVNDPDSAVEMLKSTGITATVTEVLGIAVKDIPGGFAAAISVLSDANIAIDYLYAFISRKDGLANVILRVGNNEAAAKVLTNAGIKLVSQDDIF